jgi:uncharacterized protein YjdB
MKASHLTAAVVFGLLAVSCGRDPLLHTPQGVGDGGGRGGTGGTPFDGGRGGADGGGTGGVGLGDGSTSDVRPGEFPLVLLPTDVPPLPVGRSFRMRALVRLVDEWRDVSNDPQISWQTAQTSIAEVAPGNGKITGLKPGTALVRAIHPLFGAAQTTITVTGSQIAQVTITPSPADVLVGQTRQLSAQVMYDDGSTALVTDAAVWASADQRIVRVQTSTPPLGELTGVLAGTVDVSADFGGATGTVKVTVTGTGAPVLTIAPPATSLAVGSTTRFQALLRQPSGVATDVSMLAVWASSNTAVARSLGGGQVRCVAPGSCNISVSHSMQMVAASLQCTPAGAVTLKELRILPSGSNAPLFVMARYGLMLEAINSDGTTMTVTNATQITWTSSDDATASIDSNATLVGHTPGMVTITARFGGLETSEMYTFVAR